MIAEMANILEDFPGAANQTRCFLHILNLTAKSILRQFEVPRKKKGEANNDSQPTVGMEIDEDEPSVDDELDGEDHEDESGNFEDNEEGLEDERQELSEEHIAELEQDVSPVRLMLTKVTQRDKERDKELTKFFSASRHFTHDEELLYYYSSSVDGQSERARTGYSHDASRRFNTMEFNFRYARLCNHLPFGT